MPVRRLLVGVGHPEHRDILEGPSVICIRSASRFERSRCRKRRDVQPRHSGGDDQVGLRPETHRIMVVEPWSSSVTYHHQNIDVAECIHHFSSKAAMLARCGKVIGCSEQTRRQARCKKSHPKSPARDRRALR